MRGLYDKVITAISGRRHGGGGGEGGTDVLSGIETLSFDNGAGESFFLPDITPYIARDDLPVIDIGNGAPFSATGNVLDHDIDLDDLGASIGSVTINRNGEFIA